MNNMNKHMTNTNSTGNRRRLGFWTRLGRRLDERLSEWGFFDPIPVRVTETDADTGEQRTGWSTYGIERAVTTHAHSVHSQQEDEQTEYDTGGGYTVSTDATLAPENSPANVSTDPVEDLHAQWRAFFAERGKDGVK